MHGHMNVKFSVKYLFILKLFHCLHEEGLNQVHTAISVVNREVLQTLPVLWDDSGTLAVKTVTFQIIMVPSSLGSSSLL